MIFKKGQEEMVGFVVIIVLVSIGFLIFLLISINNPSNDISADSSEISHFLDSSMEYTTDCEVKFEGDYFDLGELFLECRDGNNCLNGENSCDVLKKDLVGIIDASFVVNEESNIKGFEFISYFSINSSSIGSSIIELKKGNCTGRIEGATFISPSLPGVIRSEMRVCY